MGFRRFKQHANIFKKGARPMLRILRKCFRSYASVSRGACSQSQGPTSAARHFLKQDAIIQIRAEMRRVLNIPMEKLRRARCPRASPRRQQDFLPLAANPQEAPTVHIAPREGQTRQECFLKTPTQSSVCFVQLTTMYFTLVSVPL